MTLPNPEPVAVPAWLPADSAARTQARHHDLISLDGIEVDAGMVPLLQTLWSRGVETHQSCEGFANDYDPARLFEVWTDSAWIGFNDLAIAYEFMGLLLDESDWSHPGERGAIWLMPTGVPGHNVRAGIVCFPPELLAAAERAAARLSE